MDRALDPHEADGLVVAPKGVRADAKLDAQMLGTVLEVARDLAAERAGDFATEEARDVAAAEFGDGMVEQARVHGPEGRKTLERRVARPFAPVEEHLDWEGKPGLDARVHEAGHGIHEVGVEVQALAPPEEGFETLGGAIAEDVVPDAGFDA